MFAPRSVTSVVPPVPVCATPLPSDGSSVDVLLTFFESIVRSPYVELGLFTYTLPGPPLRLEFFAPGRAFRLFSTVPLAEPLYSMAIAPPPPPPQFHGSFVSAPRASIAPEPAMFDVVTQIEPPAPLRSQYDAPFARMAPSTVRFVVISRRMPPPQAQ